MADSKKLCETFTGSSDEIIKSCKIRLHLLNNKTNNFFQQQQENVSETPSLTTLTTSEKDEQYASSSTGNNNGMEESSFIANSLKMLEQSQNELQATTDETNNKWEI